VSKLAARITKLDPDRQQPLYRQIQAVIRDAVADRTLRPDDALPPERELAADFGVSRITIRKAIEGLVKEGVLDTHHGSGTFIRSRVEKNFAQLTSFSEERSARGLTASSRWMAIEYATVLANCLASLDAVDKSLYVALRDTGNHPVRALQRLSALILNEEQAALLGATAGDAGLLVERVGFNESGTAIEFTQSYYRGDTYDFVAELSTD
jgi:GntR family transcriptional regulator